MKKTELIVALDVPEAQLAREIVTGLKGLDVIYKVGSELFLAAGPGFVKELTSEGQRVFLDLKFHDIPNTVCKAALQAAQLGVAMFTLHLSGGKKMVQEVKTLLVKTHKPQIKVLGVSVLTSFDEKEWSETCFAIARQKPSIVESVQGLVKLGIESQLDGIVCSAHELPQVRALSGTLYTVVPGIRPTGFSGGDQARIVTPADARNAGASAIVVGRPITEAQQPRQVAEAVIKELTH